MRVPVTRTIPAVKDPVEVFRILKGLSKQVFMLESLEDKKEWGRWTFLGYDPTLEVSCAGGNLRVKNGSTFEIVTDDPGAYLKKMVEENRTPVIGGLPPLTGGLVGYFSFDFIKYAEKTLRGAGGLAGVSEREDNKEAANTGTFHEETFKDFDLMLFDTLIVFDNLSDTIMLIVNVKTDAEAENRKRAEAELAMMENIVRNGEKVVFPPLLLQSAWNELFSRDEYCRMVEKAKRHIIEGDVFQVVLSNRLDARAEGSLFDTYLALRRINPSPYMFYFASDDVEIAGASPETLVKLKEGVLHTFPLAGTRPRGKTADEDTYLEKDLLADEKEKAEHNMLVDLGRNDLGKISEFGSVKVEKYLSIERFSHVMHIGSTVRGLIKENKTALDAIDAVLPAGTLSGAPKIRACQIIADLERCPRGIYGGAIGYIDFSGNMDTCIAIRLAFKKNGRVFVRSGAGIVADSVPEREYEECRNKMQAVVNALEEVAKPRRGKEGNDSAAFATGNQAAAGMGDGASSRTPSGAGPR
jgi:anthranilate synthase component 1